MDGTTYGWQVFYNRLENFWSTQTDDIAISFRTRESDGSLFSTYLHGQVNMHKIDQYLLKSSANKRTLQLLAPELIKFFLFKSFMISLRCIAQCFKMTIAIHYKYYHKNM